MPERLVIPVHDTTCITQKAPQCLRIRPQWLVWRNEEVKGRRTKVPYDANTGRKASSTAPLTWATFEMAVACYAKSTDYDGVGFVFTPDDPFCGIDLDDCLGEDRSLAPWARDVLARFPTYTEISPSGKGLKVYLRGRKPDFAGCSVKKIDLNGGPGELELYDHGRYFTVTGELWPGSATDVVDCQTALDALCQRLWGQVPRPPTQAPAKEQCAAQLQAPSQVHGDDRVARCLATMLNLDITDKSDGSFRLFAAACRCVEHDLTDDEALVCLRAYAALKPFARKWSPQDLLKRLRDAERKTERGAAVAEGVSLIRPAYKTVGELLVGYPELRRPIIHGLLREGETMNVIAPSKTGKSWLVTDLALAVASGRPWLGTYQTSQGKVLILDNELHGETSANRIPKVANARLIPLAGIASQVFVENMRGRLVDLFQLESYFDAIGPGTFTLVILDAFYRFVPKGTDENDNGTVAQLYNHIDRYAQRLGCSFVLIHHTSKGSQSGKAITDVGAGAGSQSRATDTHLILRPHQEDRVVVLDAAVRSWQPVAPMCLRWEFPIWTPAPDLDPADLRPERPRRKAKADARGGVVTPPKPVWNVEKFVAGFVTVEGRQTDTIIGQAMQKGLSQAAAKRFLSQAADEGKVFRWTYGASKPIRYATVSQPLIEGAVGGKKDVGQEEASVRVCARAPLVPPECA